MHASPRLATNRARYLPWIVAGGLLLGVAIVYGQTLWFDFVDYDDPVFVTNCPQVRAGLTGKSIYWALTSGPAGEWYPLSMFSHMLDCQLFGMHAWGHHLTNLVLHAATAIALFLVLRSMTAQRAVPAVAGYLPTTPRGREVASGVRADEGGPERDNLWLSALVAAIFALHPQHVESVAWIAERRDVLSGLFFVLTLAAYVGYVRHGRAWWRYLLVAVLLSLGLMSKAMLVTLPPLLLLLDYWPLGRFGQAADLPATAAANPRQGFWPLVLEKLPLAALAVADVLATLETKSPQPYHVPWGERLANAAVASVAYLEQFFVPRGLSIAYPYPEVPWPAWQVAASMALLALLTIAAVLPRRSLPYLLVGWLWYLLMLIPVLGFVSIGPHLRADRYTYLPQIGLTLALVWGASRLAARWSLSRGALWTGAVAMLLALMACSWQQVGFWKSNQALWARALECNPNNIYAHYMYAARLEGAGDHRGAADHYRLAVELWPREQTVYGIVRAESHNALGNFAERAGNIDEALGHFQAAWQWEPDYYPALLNLGRMLLMRGRVDEAIGHLQKCVELIPRDPRPYCALAMAFAEKGDIARGISEYHRALDVAPGFGPAVRGVRSLMSEAGPGSSGQR